MSLLELAEKITLLDEPTQKTIGLLLVRIEHTRIQLEKEEQEHENLIDSCSALLNMQLRLENEHETLCKSLNKKAAKRQNITSAELEKYHFIPHYLKKVIAFSNRMCAGLARKGDIVIPGLIDTYDDLGNRIETIIKKFIPDCNINLTPTNITVLAQQLSLLNDKGREISSPTAIGLFRHSPDAFPKSTKNVKFSEVNSVFLFEDPTKLKSIACEVANEEKILRR